VAEPGSWEPDSRLEGRRVVASISGGKDSAAMSLWLTEQGVEHDRVFMDTGWEHRATYEYLRGELTRVIGPITEIRADETLPEMAIRKGIFPSRLRRWCTERLKVNPIKAHLAEMAEQGIDFVSAVGIRAAESESRSKLTEWEWSDAFDCEIWRPILRWTEHDVIDIHKRHGLRPNPLYLLGASRVGCWPCIYAGKDEIRLMATIDPGRVDEIRELEAAVTESARVLIEGRGDTMEYGRTFFRERTKGEAWPIDRAVAWSKTAHGGRQYELFAAQPGEQGCMRWGMCDTGDSDE